MQPLLIGALVIAGLLLGSVTSILAVSPTNVATFNQWSTVHDCTYLIFTDGTTTYAKNCDTGVIDYSGTTTHSVFNSAVTAIDALGGGTIFVKSGTYLLTSNILIGGVDNLKIVGENRATTILRGSGNPLNLIRQITTPISNFTLQNIELDGNDVADIVVYFAGGLNGITLDNVYAHHSDSTFVVFFDGSIGTNSGIRLMNSHFAYSANGFDIVGSGGSNYLVDNNIFENEPGRSGEGFAITNGKKIIITNNQFRSFVGAGFSGNAIHTENNANNDITIANNYFHMYNGYAIDIGGDTLGAKNTRFTIANNIVDATPARVTGTQIANGINLRGAQHGSISGNIFYNTTRYGVQGVDIQDVVIDNNIFIDSSWANFGHVMGDGVNRQGGAINILNSSQALTTKSHIVISNNIMRDITTTQSSGILVDNQYASVYITGNDPTAVGSSLKIVSLATGAISHNSGFVSENTFQSATFTINATGVKTLTTAHGLSYTPAIEDCSITVLEVTNVDDWAYNLLKIDSVDSTNVVAKINVSTASATGGATARLGISCFRG